MLSEDEDAVICDLAETYGIFDYQALPPSMVAVLVFGLSENSRIKRKMSGQKIPTETMLLAAVLDELSVLVWMQTEDGQHGRNYPVSVLSELTELNAASPQGDIESYQSGEEFMRARAERMKIHSESEAIEI